MAASKRNSILGSLALLLFAAVQLWGQEAKERADGPKAIEVRLNRRGAFGLVAVDKNELRRRLTYSPDGGTNTAVFFIDNKIVHFGSGAGILKTSRDKIPAQPVKEDSLSWNFDKIEIAQQIRVVAGSQAKRETCLIQYHITNQDKAAHKVGFRFLLDLLIGENDAPACALPDRKELIVKGWQASDGKVPPFLSFHQFANLEKPGLTSYLSLRSIGDGARVDRVQITTLPLDSDDWKVPHADDLKGDSVVVLYWEPREIAPNSSQVFTFAYGLDVVEKGKAKQKNP